MPSEYNILIVGVIKLTPNGLSDKILDICVRPEQISAHGISCLAGCESLEEIHLGRDTQLIPEDSNTPFDSKVGQSFTPWDRRAACYCKICSSVKIIGAAWEGLELRASCALLPSTGVYDTRLCLHACRGSH